MKSNIHRSLIGLSVLLFFLPMTACAPDPPSAVRAEIQPDGGLFVLGKTMDADEFSKFVTRIHPKAVTIALTRSNQLPSLRTLTDGLTPSVVAALTVELPPSSTAESLATTVLDWRQTATILYSTGRSSDLPMSRGFHAARASQGRLVPIEEEDIPGFAHVVSTENPDPVFLVFFDDLADPELFASTVEKLRQKDVKIYRELNDGFQLVADTGFGIPNAPAVDEPISLSEVEGDVKAPEKFSYPQPQYTEAALKARLQGIVIVQTTIDRQGNVTYIKVLKGLPMGLNEEATKAIKQWKFKPATLNGKPVEVLYNLTVNFRLK